MSRWILAALILLLILSTISQGCSGSRLTVNITTEGQGTTDPVDGGKWPRGTIVNVRAIPEPFWRFDYWSGDHSGTAYAFSFEIKRRVAFVAHFSPYYQTRSLFDEDMGVPTDDYYRYGWGFNEVIVGMPPETRYAHSHSFIVTAATMRDVTVSGTFSVASGHQIEAIILDDANYAALRTGKNWTALYSLETTGSGTLDVPITPPGEGQVRYWLTFVDLSSTEPSVLRARAEIDLNWTQRS